MPELPPPCTPWRPRLQRFRTRRFTLGNSRDRPIRPSNPFSEMVNVGIDDLDPSRILRDCEHMFVTLGRHGHTNFHTILAQQQQLLRWAKGLALYLAQVNTDGTHERFRTEYCDKFPNRVPGPQGWQYTHEWQQSENQLNGWPRKHSSQPSRLLNREDNLGTTGRVLRLGVKPDYLPGIGERQSRKPPPAATRVLPH
jgi:hypothetical protein